MTPEQIIEATEAIETLRTQKVAQLKSLQSLIDAIDLTIDQMWIMWKDACNTIDRQNMDQIEAEEA